VRSQNNNVNNNFSIIHLFGGLRTLWG